MTDMLRVFFEPIEDDCIVYLPLAKKTQESEGTWELALMMVFSINFSGVNIVEARIHFPQTSIPSIKVPMNVWVSGASTLRPPVHTLGPFVLPKPAALDVRIEFDYRLSIIGSMQTLRVDKPLKRNINPLTGGTYNFPGKKPDLREGELWQHAGVAHSAGFGSSLFGTSLFAYDLNVTAYDRASRTWSDRLPGTDGSAPQHYRAWGKPVYAMAEGTVIGFRSDATTSNPTEGNHFWIQHGEEVALYAHLQGASMNPSLLEIGRTVQRGQLLGQVGNSGNAPAPHLHVQVLKGNQPWGGTANAYNLMPKPRPLPFRGIAALERDAMYRPNAYSPFVPVKDEGLPDVLCVIDPAPIIVVGSHIPSLETSGVAGGGGRR